MAIFESRESAVEVFTKLFTILLQDETFVTRMRNAGITLRLVHTKPEFELFVTPDSVAVDSGETKAVITIKMSCDTAHSLWLGKLVMPIALALGKVRIKGNVAKVLEFTPLLQPAFDRYEEISKPYVIN